MYLVKWLSVATHASLLLFSIMAWAVQHYFWILYYSYLIFTSVFGLFYCYCFLIVIFWLQLCLWRLFTTIQILKLKSVYSSLESKFYLKPDLDEIFSLNDGELHITMNNLSSFLFTYQVFCIHRPSNHVHHLVVHQKRLFFIHRNLKYSVLIHLYNV